MCHTAIPNLMCGQRDGSLRELGEGGTAGDLGFELIIILSCEVVCHF